MFLGSLSDRIGRRKVLIPSLIFFSLASGVSGLAGGFMSLLLIRGVMGVAEGAFCPTSFAAVAEASKPSRIGFNQGLQQSMFALFGLGFGPFIAAWLLSFTTWRGVFLLVTVPGLILSALIWMCIRDRTPAATQSDSVSHRPSEPSASIGQVLKVRNVRIGMLGLLCAMCGIFTLAAFAPLYLTEHLHLDAWAAASAASAIGFGGFAGQWILPTLSDIYGRRPMAILGFLGGAIFVFAFINTGASILPLFGTLFGATVCSFGLLSLISGPIAAESAPPGMVSTAAGLIIGVGEVFGGGLALVVAGYLIATYGIQSMLYLALGGLAIGVLLMFFLKETAPRKLAITD
ncbi:MFS transporter (plasmid) [Sphingobium amiense]|uniref:MFS transporter n=2 Tax=Sphingobium TaxID=165695 RepID=A0A1E1F8Y3_9SPHN|nr:MULTISPECIES: MFS transporter [Sphingobium]BAV66968.1 MFS transporter [Sphingobium cloacae]BBE00492.1 MFS transporter [Sphingobium amiense]